MSKLVVVSNRLPHGRVTGIGGELEIPAGGLVSALLAALERRPGNLWFGWDGRVSPDLDLQRFTIKGVELAGVALSRAEKKDYYLGFCNQALWPLLHCFQDRVSFLPAQMESYVEVQRRFARELVKLLAPGDRVWVHDYHLFLLGRELRRQGFRGRLGFFLHTPFPPHDLWALLPQAEDFLSALLAFDLVGFHTESYVHNYADACQRLAGTSWDGEQLSGGPLAGSGRAQRVGVFPVGIEAQDFEPNQRALGRAKTASYLAELVGGRKTVLAVDRLDYTKGLAERFRTFEQFLVQHPEWQNRVTLVQVASPSRGTLPFYRRERREVELLAGHINGMLGEGDWVPIRYFHRSFPKPALARLYRGADVGLVTPLRDGMNLVAKEFVASQRPQDPGVLVLSRFAGAAEDLAEAIQVNPFAPAEVAGAIARALEMPLTERQARYERLLARVRERSATAWADRFTRELEGAAPRLRLATVAAVAGE